MLRRRLIRALALLAGMGAILYVMVSVYIPSSRRLIFGIDKRTGAVRVVQSQVTFLPPFQFYRLAFDRREDSAQRQGAIGILSKEGVPVTLDYTMRFRMSGDRFPDARRLFREGWGTWIRTRIGEAASAVTAQVSLEDILSPVSPFHRQGALRDAVARHLAANGIRVTAFDIARFEVDRETWLRYKRLELRRDWRGSPTRVAVFAIDGADWELLRELAGDGRLPNLKALWQGGTSAAVQTIQPAVPPAVWTTVATGLPPDRHGVLDFTDPATHAPVDAYSRHAPALWDIAGAFGRSALTVNWWTAWPPAAGSGSVFDTPGPTLRSAVYPIDLAPRTDAATVPLARIGYDQVHRFLNLTATDFNHATASGNSADPVNVFRGVLAKTWTDHRAAIRLYQEQKPLLLMMSYDGTDAVNHLFGPYHPPYRDGVSEDGYRKYRTSVASYYTEVDRLIGEWLKILPPDSTVIVTSAYGFAWGATRPRSLPDGRSTLAAHRSPGLFIASGPRVSPSREAHVMSIYDVTPTLLALLGLPPSSEMPGRAATWAFKDLAPVTSVQVVSYGELIGGRQLRENVRADPAAYQKELQALGHLSEASRDAAPARESADGWQAAELSPAGTWGAYAYYNNLGARLRAEGKAGAAVEALDQAIERNPARATPYLNRAMALFDRQQYAEADAGFLAALAHGLPEAGQSFTGYAALYRQKSLPARAIAILRQGKEMFPQSARIAGSLGTSLLTAGQTAEGVSELERALTLQPSSTLALHNLGTFYAKRNDYGRALDYWNRSLSIEPHQPDIVAAAAAARARL